jgi:hypothetical protein
VPHRRTRPRKRQHAPQPDERLARGFEVVEPAPDLRLSEHGQRMLQAIARRPCRPLEPGQRAVVTSLRAGGNRGKQAAFTHLLLRAGEREPVIRRNDDRRGRHGIGLAPDVEETQQFPLRRGFAVDQAVDFFVLARRQPEWPLAAPVGIQETRIGMHILAPADEYAPLREIAERAADEHAQGAGIGELPAQVGQAHAAGRRFMAARIGQAYQQPDRLVAGRLPLTLCGAVSSIVTDMGEDRNGRHQLCTRRFRTRREVTAVTAREGDLPQPSRPLKSFALIPSKLLM